jgi:hypothetical protein
MAKKGKTHIRESWKNTSKKGNNLGRNSSLSRNSSHRQCVLRRNSGVWAIFIGRALLVLADVSQPIQKIIGIGCITSADTNNVSGIRGVPPPTRNPNRGEIWFCAVRLPNLSAASLDATPLPAVFFPASQKPSLQHVPTLARRPRAPAAAARHLGEEPMKPPFPMCFVCRSCTFRRIRRRTLHWIWTFRFDLWCPIFARSGCPCVACGGRIAAPCSGCNRISLIQWAENETWLIYKVSLWIIDTET